MSAILSREERWDIFRDIKPGTEESAEASELWCRRQARHLMKMLIHTCPHTSNLVAKHECPKCWGAIWDEVFKDA